MNTMMITKSKSILVSVHDQTKIDDIMNWHSNNTHEWSFMKYNCDMYHIFVGNIMVAPLFYNDIYGINYRLYRTLQKS